MKFQIELTDTFGGGANYLWVRRAEFEAPEDASDRLLVRRGKRALGISDQRHKTEQWGETIALQFPGQCIVAFIDYCID